MTIGTQVYFEKCGLHFLNIFQTPKVMKKSRDSTYNSVHMIVHTSAHCLQKIIIITLGLVPKRVA